MRKEIGWKWSWILNKFLIIVKPYRLQFVFLVFTLGLVKW